jgi:hypothetical protein
MNWSYRKFLLSIRERMSEGQVREKGVIKKKSYINQRWLLLKGSSLIRLSATFSLMEKGIFRECSKNKTPST